MAQFNITGGLTQGQTGGELGNNPPQFSGSVQLGCGAGGEGGTTDYNDLLNKPQINSVELVGNKTLSQLGIEPAKGADDNYITDAEKAELHTHTNKSVLDTITSILVSGWNAAATWVSTYGSSVLTHIGDSTIHVTSTLLSTINNKVDKIAGKGLSTNDFTDDYKSNGLVGTGNTTLTTLKQVADRTELTSNLNNNAKLYSKLSALDELRNYYFDKLNQTSFRVVGHDGINAAEYLFKKDTNDDFFKLNNVRLCLLNDINRNFYNSAPADRTGTFIGTVGNLYTTTIGDKYVATVVGECIKLYCFTDNRGGIWEVVVDDDYNNKIYVSTYAATSGQRELVVGRTFRNGKHKVEATFRGADPANPPSGGIARGWMYYTDTPTIYGTVLGFNYNSDNVQLELLGVESNKEIAFQAKIGNETNFFPDHGVGTAIRTDFKMYLNKLLVDFFAMPTGTHIQVDSFRMYQKMKYRQPIAGDVADVIFTHDFLSGEFIFRSNVKFLQAVTLLNYYPLMMPLYTTGDKFYLGSDREITTTGNNAITTYSPESVSLPDVCTIHAANSNVTTIGCCSAKLNSYDTSKTSLFLWDRATYPKLYYNLVLLNTPAAIGESITGFAKFKMVYSENVKGVISQY